VEVEGKRESLESGARKWTMDFRDNVGISLGIRSHSHCYF